MSLYTRVVSELLFPLHERMKGHTTRRIYKELVKTQWQTPEELQSLQVIRLRELLEHAYSSSEFYRDRMNASGMLPSDVRSVADLVHIPPLTKDDIRSNSEAIKSFQSKYLNRFSTTGSSGDPLIFYVSRVRVSHDVAAKWRATNWWNVNIGDRELVAWSSPIELNRHGGLKTLRDLVLRSRLENAIKLDDARCDQILEKLAQFKPMMLFGYPSSLALLAQRALVRDLRLETLGIRVAFVTGERSFPHHRQIIEKAFGCRMANGYGGRDAGFIAHECPEGGMHITSEDLIVEIVDSNNRPLPLGSSGEVIVTHLFSYGFPFIRYRNGDIAQLSDRLCKCGRGLPLIEDIQGRTNDFLISDSGAYVHGVNFGLLLRETEGVRGFQFVQESRDFVRVSLVVEDQFDKDKAVVRIREFVREKLGRRVNAEVQYVDRIPAEGSGKFRYVICKVPKP